MSRGIYFYDNNQLLTVVKGYVGIGGQARKIVKRYVGINNKAYQFYPPYIWNKYQVNQFWTQSSSNIDFGNTQSIMTCMTFAASQLRETFGLISYSQKNTDFTVNFNSSTGLFSASGGNSSSWIFTNPINNNLIDRNQPVSYFKEDGSYNFIKYLWVIDGTATWEYIGVCSYEGYLGWEFKPGIHHYAMYYDKTDSWNPKCILYRSDLQKTQGVFIEQVTATTSNAYPDNRIGNDGYWYVKQF